MNIHPTAIVANGAKLHPSVKVGPYSVIGPNVEIGEGTVISSHCNIEGYTTIGKNNTVFPSVSIGCPPQDLKYSGERSAVIIGDGNHFREFVTVHTAEGEGKTTKIGSNNMLMAYVHIAHNCSIGDNIIMANCASLAGHAHVGDRAVLGGFVGVHQFCHVGSLVMVGGLTKITKDVPPFIKIDGNPARVIGLNSIGLKRNGVPKESIDKLRTLYKLFFRSEMNVSQVMEHIKTRADLSDEYIDRFSNFVASSTRGIYKRSRGSLD